MRTPSHNWPDCARYTAGNSCALLTLSCRSLQLSYSSKQTIRGVGRPCVETIFERLVLVNFFLPFQHKLSSHRGSTLVLSETVSTCWRDLDISRSLYVTQCRFVFVLWLCNCRRTMSPRWSQIIRRDPTQSQLLLMIKCTPHPDHILNLLQYKTRGILDAGGSYGASQCGSVQTLKTACIAL